MLREELCGSVSVDLSKGKQRDGVSERERDDAEERDGGNEKERKRE